MFCEKNLYRAFSDGLPEINTRVSKVELLNEESFVDNTSMEIIDFNQTFGVSIDREENRVKEVAPFSNRLFKNRAEENFDLYMPNIKNFGDKLSLNMSLLVKVETNLKLNLIFDDGSSLIPVE